MSRGITHPCILLLSYTYTHDSIKTFSERKLNSWSKYKSLGFIKRSRETQTTHILQIQPINPLKFPHNSQFRSFFLFSSFSRQYRTRSRILESIKMFRHLRANSPSRSCLPWYLYIVEQAPIDPGHRRVCTRRFACDWAYRRHQPARIVAPISRSYRGFPPFFLFRSLTNPTHPRNPSHDTCTEVRRRCIARSCKSFLPPPPWCEQLLPYVLLLLLLLPYDVEYKIVPVDNRRCPRIFLISWRFGRMRLDGHRVAYYDFIFNSREMYEDFINFLKKELFGRGDPQFSGLFLEDFRPKNSEFREN